MNNVLKDKLDKYEATPPPGVWEAVSAALDEAAMGHEFPKTLHDLSVPPPSTTWRTIAEKMDESAIPASHTITKSKFPIVRYAAAAIFIALLAWGALMIVNKQSTADSDVAGTTRDPVITNPVINPPAEVDNSDVEPITEETVLEQRDNAALEQSKKTYASLSHTSTKAKNAANFYFDVPEYYPGITRGLHFEEPADEPDLSNRYIMLMTPDGNIIRMSKKLSELVCCVAGETEDDICVDQMKKWREKLANPSSTHSPADFMDILSLIKSL